MPESRDIQSAPTQTLESPGARAEESREQPQLLLSAGMRLLDRYEIVRCIGRGGAGQVYDAIDHERMGMRVAIKLLVDRRPQPLYRLKNEFRSLADVTHPNLVGLHALCTDGPRWFVVMDLVHGQDFLSYTRPHGLAVSESRLRDALAQLVRGVSAIHQAGKLHRDLKPSNVLVNEDGRVVVVDFGLVRDLEPDALTSVDGWFAGTPAYSAPEQTGGSRDIGSSADLYAIGGMLYHALTGQLPFDGEASAVLAQKAREDVTFPEPLSAELPPDLVALCRELLARNPQARPGVENVLARLGEAPSPQPDALTSLPFVGRQRELALLRDAHLGARDGAVRVALVQGPSGIGKSALLAHFAERVRTEFQAVVLQGRCYARDEAPLRAFDMVVDGLGHFLARLPDAEANALMPRDVALLARVFPTLERVRAVGRMPVRLEQGADEAQLRGLAVAALKELLARIADRRPLVIALDDLQWGDADSAALLRDLVLPPGAPACLIICAFRSDEVETSIMLSRLRNSLPLAPVEVPLAALGESEGLMLAQSMLGSELGPNEARELAVESGGNPFFVRELCRHARSFGAVPSVHEVIAQRLLLLGDDERRVLETVCIAGHPVEARVALQAAGCAPTALPALIASCLLRLRVIDGREHLESYHDRVRAAVVEAISAGDLKLRHAALAESLEAEASTEAERLVQHFVLAGLPERAATYARKAARDAERALAFARAAELYRLALTHDPDDLVLIAALADSCRKCGRSFEAAVLYEQLWKRAAGKERMVYGPRAMMLYLLGGHIERGSTILYALCRELKMITPPRSHLLGILLALVLYWMYRAGRRIASLPEPTNSSAEPELPAQKSIAQRVNLAYQASLGIGNYSSRQAAHFVALSLLQTRRYRDARHWPLAVVWDVGIDAVERGSVTPAQEAAAARAVKLAEARGEPDLLALVLVTEGSRYIYQSELRRAEGAFARAEQVLAEHGRSAPPVETLVRCGQYAASQLLGEFDRVLADSDGWLAYSETHEDPYGALVVRVMGSLRYLVCDDPDAARQSLAALQTPMGRAAQFAADPWWLADTELYAGDPGAALQACLTARKAPTSTAVGFIPLTRSWRAFTEGRVALACAAAGVRARGIAAPSAQVRKLRREGYHTAQPMAALIAAGIAFQEQAPERAHAELRTAIDGFDKFELVLHATAARFRLGQLIGGDAGRELIAAAEAKARSCRVKNPMRHLSMIAPGFDR